MPRVDVLHAGQPTDQEITDRLKANACSICGKSHPQPWKHAGFCVATGCTNLATKHQGKSSLHCEIHSVEDGDRIEPRNKDGAFLALSQELADLMPKAAPLVPLDDEGADFTAWSRTNRCYYWPMVWTLDGRAIHWGESCIGEKVRGPFGCRHSIENGRKNTRTRIKTQPRTFKRQRGENDK